MIPTITKRKAYPRQRPHYREDTPMKGLFGSTLLTAALIFPSTMYADPTHDSGQVQEIIVKIETKDGVKWYKLGKEMKPFDVKAGDHVSFDYADDTIESITPASSPGTANEPQSAPEKVQ